MALAVAGVAVAGCGGSGNSKQDKAFLSDANARCYAQLSRPGVFAALDATRFGSPREDLMLRAQTALAAAAQDLDSLRAPTDKRDAQTTVSSALRTGSDSIAQYLHDKQQNESRTTDDWNSVVAQLSNLQQTSYERGMKGCAIPVSL